MDNSTTFRVYNNTNYDIGITLSTNQQRAIRAGTFLPNISVEDILFIENNARCKPFSSKLLLVKDTNDKELSLEDIGGYTDPYAEKHFSPDEIAAQLEKSAKSIAAWLKDIEDPIELDAIRDMADKMDLPGSKLKVIQAKIPNRNMLESDEE
jgi:hypothetical protein